MPLTTREKWAIGGTVAAVGTAIVIGVVASKSSAASKPPLGNQTNPPNKIVQKIPPTPPKQVPPKGQQPSPQPINPNAVNQVPQGPPQASNAPQTFDVTAGGTYSTNPAPGGTLLTINMPAGTRGTQATVGPGIRSGSSLLTGRQFFATLDGQAGETSVSWVDASNTQYSATLNIVGVTG